MRRMPIRYLPIPEVDFPCGNLIAVSRLALGSCPMSTLALKEASLARVYEVHTMNRTTSTGYSYWFEGVSIELAGAEAVVESASTSTTNAKKIISALVRFPLFPEFLVLNLLRCFSQ